MGISVKDTPVFDELGRPRFLLEDHEPIAELV
jgi:hypothetical protein